MKRFLIGAGTALFFFGIAYGQKPVTKPAKPQKKVALVATYLGESEKTGGPIDKKTFDELMRHGVKAKDSAGASLPVVGFQFTYAERGIFEDSVGKLISVIDYLSEYCFGDTLTATISASLYDRTKPGDTVYIDRIKVRKPNGTEAMGKTLKFVLAK